MLKSVFTYEQQQKLFSAASSRKDFSLRLFEELFNQKGILEGTPDAIKKTVLSKVRLQEDEFLRLLDEVVERGLAEEFGSLVLNPHITSIQWEHFLENYSSSLFGNYEVSETSGDSWFYALKSLVRSGNVHDSLVKSLTNHYPELIPYAINNPHLTCAYRKTLILKVLNGERTSKISPELLYAQEYSIFGEDELTLILGAFMWESIAPYCMGTGNASIQNPPPLVKKAISLGYVPRGRLTECGVDVFYLLANDNVGEEVIQDFFDSGLLDGSPQALLSALRNTNIHSEKLVKDLWEALANQLKNSSGIPARIAEAKDFSSIGLRTLLKDASFEMGNTLLRIFPDSAEVAEIIMEVFNPAWCKKFLAEAPLELVEEGKEMYEKLYGNLFQHKSISLDLIDQFLAQKIDFADLEIEESLWAGKYGVAYLDEYIKNGDVSYEIEDGLALNPFLNVEQVRLLIEEDIISSIYKEKFYVNNGALLSLDEREFFFVHKKIDLQRFFYDIKTMEQLKALVEEPKGILDIIKQDSRMLDAYQTKKINFAYMERLKFLEEHNEEFFSSFSQASFFYTLLFQDLDMDIKTIVTLTHLTFEDKPTTSPKEIEEQPKLGQNLI
jgi:hypothetical protein